MSGGGALEPNTKGLDTEPDSQQDDARGGGVRALERGLRIIAQFSAAHPSWSIAGLSKALGLSKTTTRRLVKTLESEGFLLPEVETGQYRLGSKLFSVAYLARSYDELVRIAHPYLVQLAALTEETVGMTVWTDSGPLLLDNVPTKHFFKPSLSPGSMYPEHGSTHSKIFLAFGPEERQSKLFFADRQHPITLADAALLHEKLDAVKKTGVAWDFEERIQGVCAVGVPVREGSSEVVAAIGVVAPKERFGPEQRERLARLAQEAAAVLSSALGYEGTAESPQANQWSAI
jgi:IclR family transcriptional regulator, KDG regulon repressor